MMTALAEATVDSVEFCHFFHDVYDGIGLGGAAFSTRVAKNLPQSGSEHANIRARKLQELRDLLATPHNTIGSFLTFQTLRAQLPPG